MIASVVSGLFSRRDYDCLQLGSLIADDTDNIQPYPEFDRADSDDKKYETSETALKVHRIYKYSVSVTLAKPLKVF